VSAFDTYDNEQWQTIVVVDGEVYHPRCAHCGEQLYPFATDGCKGHRVGPATNQGHQWTAAHDDDRVECVWCGISPLSAEAKYPCNTGKRMKQGKYMFIEAPDMESDTNKEIT